MLNNKGITILKVTGIAIVFMISSVIAQCDWNGDETLDVVDVVQMVDCILSDCAVFGCTDSDAMNYNPEANIENGHCIYDIVCMDYDGNTYETVLIGERIWMAENLKTTHYNSGNEIQTDWPSFIGSYTVYDNDPSNADIYGNLYNWYALNDDQGICPEGFHMPTDDEWVELEMVLGMSFGEAYDSSWRGTDQGSQLAGNADLWNSGELVNNPAFGTSGFLALPGGDCEDINEDYFGIGSHGFFWSGTESDGDHAWGRELGDSYSEIYRYYYYKRNGFSVRCVSNTP